MKMLSLIFIAFLAITQVASLHPLSDEFIDLVNEKATTWKAGRNFPKDTPMKRIRRLTGTFKEPTNSNLKIVSHEISKNFTFPMNFDARENWPYCPTLREIRDQGDCGDCWAASAVEVMSDRQCILSNGEQNFHYSLEHVVSCCDQSLLMSGCDGGFVSAAFDCWIYGGIVSGGNYNSSEGCQPYQIPCDTCYSNLKDGTPECEHACQPEYNIAYEDDLHFGEIEYGLGIKNITNAQYDLIMNGPITAAFDVYDDFLLYQSGVYYHTEGGYVGGHAIKIIGYGVEDGIDYWLCANSWNTDWGDKGFFKIRKGTNECTIEEFMMSGIPKFD